MFPSNKNNTKFENTISNYGIFFIFASLLYQPFLCFANSHLFQVGKGSLILIEILLVAGGLALFLRKMHVGFMLFLIFLFVNALFLSLFKGYFDPKNIRDFLIPILMLWLGINYNNKIEINKLIKYCAIMVLAIGLFELAFATTYEWIFNVARYHMSIGLITDNAMQYRSDSLALNGIRQGGRNFLHFLGDHRISSVFLETVNMGNFGVVIASWGLAKDSSDKKSIFLFLGLGLAMAVLADARFGVSIIIGLTLLRFALPLSALKVLSYFTPLFIIAITLIIYANGYSTFTDDFKGRLGLTGFNLTHFDLPLFLGASNVRRFFVDSGYCYNLYNSGLIFCITTWILFCRLKPENTDGVRYKSLITIFISALLAISGSSVFAMKFTSLMWFLMGTMLIKADRSASSINSETNLNTKNSFVHENKLT